MVGKLRQLPLEAIVQIAVLVIGFAGTIAVTGYRVDTMDAKADRNAEAIERIEHWSAETKAVASANTKNIEQVSDALSSTVSALEKIVDDLHAHEVEDAADSERILQNTREINRVREKVGS